jgi:hypothetical protein
MRGGSGQRVNLINFFTGEAGVVHDLTGGAPSDHYAVLGGARLGVELVQYGDSDPKYIGPKPIIFESRPEADTRALAIASVSLAVAVDNKAPEAFPFNSADYHNLMRNEFAGYSRPYPWIHSSAIIAPVSPLWAPDPEHPFTFPLREGLEPATLLAIGQLAGIEIATAQQGGE